MERIVVRDVRQLSVLGMVMLLAMSAVGATAGPPDAPLPGSDDDAGSGQDAPAGPSPAVWVVPGVAYEGNLTGFLGDQQDWFAFVAERGQAVHLRTLGHVSCDWSVRDSNGTEVPSTCIGDQAEIHYETRLPAGGTFYLAIKATGGVPAHYRFAFWIDEDAPPRLHVPNPIEADMSPFGVDDCPGAGHGEANETHGAGDPQIPTLTWAALKTGFRAVVAWTTADDSTATLRLRLADGNETEWDDHRRGTAHSFVLDALPEGKILCFQAEHTTQTGSTVTSDWHALRLANAFNAYDEAQDAYTINLLVLANENLVDRDVLESGFDAYAARLWDASDGSVRAGALIVLYGDLDKHNSGMLTCGWFPAFALASINQYHATPTCRTLADVVFSYDQLPGRSASAFFDGIQDRWGAVYMNNLVESPPGVATAHEIGYTLLHEIGHYAFGMMDLYGFTPDNCYDAATAISVMGASRSAREFDDDTTRCPNWQNINGYTPSWTLLRERFPLVPERPGEPMAGPVGDGGAYHRHALAYMAEAYPGAS